VTHWARRNHGCRVSSCSIQGMGAVFLENSFIRVGILADKGAELFELTFKPNDMDVLWRAPQGILNPHTATPSVATPSGAFMDSYSGGWQELFPTLGAPTSYYGAPLGEHGEVAFRPWGCCVERDDEEHGAVTFEVRCQRSPFRLRRRMALVGARSSTLSISEEVTNEGGQSLELMWGHHPVFGPPFLEPGCRLTLPGGMVQPTSRDGERFRPVANPTPWPTYVPRDHRIEADLSILGPPAVEGVDECYVYDLPGGQFELRNDRLGVGFQLRWDLRVFRYLWLWRTLGPDPGYPWYSGTYTLGLEPFSSVPPDFESACRARTTLTLGPGESMHTELEATLFSTLTNGNPEGRRRGPLATSADNPPDIEATDGDCAPNGTISSDVAAPREDQR
jgi:Domain of unknown function (DUF4432)